MKEIKLPDNFCAFPFMQLATDPRGRIVPCCWNNYELGNIQENSIEEIWNSEKMQDLRSEFLTGKVKTCALHIEHRQCHKWSEKFIPLVSPSINQDLSSIKVLYAQLNGKCNLECIMCEVWTFPNGLFTEEKFWNLAESKIFPALKEIYISGGEPFILKDTYKLIEKIHSVNKACVFRFHTNAHWRFSEKIRSSIDKLNIGHISISVDSLDEKTYAVIRLKGKLQQVLGTINDICSYREMRAKRFTIQIETAIQKDNFTEVEQFVAFAKSKNFTISFSLVYIPLPLSLLNFESLEKFEILKRFLKNYENTSETTILDLIIPLVNSLNQNETLAFFRQQMPDLKDTEFSFAVAVKLGSNTFTFKLACKEHRILNHRLGEKILRLSNDASDFFYRDEHDFWMNYSTDIVPFATSVEIYNADMDGDNANQKIPVSGNSSSSAENERIELTLETIFKWFGTPGDKENAGWNSIRAVYLISMIQREYLPDKADTWIKELVGLPYSFSSFLPDRDLKPLFIDLREWGGINPNSISALENFYADEFRNWLRECERDSFLGKIKPMENINQIFDYFGKPGEVFNTGWLSLCAMWYVVVNGQAPDGSKIDSMAQLVTQLAPNFPHPIGYYLAEGKRANFISDAKKWAPQNPHEVRSFELAYKKAYERWIEERKMEPIEKRMR